MKTLAELTLRVADLETRLENMLQLAKVLKVDDATNLLDIEIRGVELKGVPYLTWRAGRKRKDLLGAGGRRSRVTVIPRGGCWECGFPPGAELSGRRSSGERFKHHAPCFSKTR